MNTTRLIAAIAITFAASGAAVAQEATYDYPQAMASQTTRAAVQADLLAARADGTLIVNEASVGGTSTFTAQRGRPAVRAEAELALKTGRAKLLSAEPHAFTVDIEPALATVILASQ